MYATTILCSQGKRRHSETVEKIRETVVVFIHVNAES